MNHQDGQSDTDEEVASNQGRCSTPQPASRMIVFGFVFGSILLVFSAGALWSLHLASTSNESLSVSPNTSTSESPSVEPSTASSFPSVLPTDVPSHSSAPSAMPSKSFEPSALPTFFPSDFPSTTPSKSLMPSMTPSKSLMPSMTPSKSLMPSMAPSTSQKPSHLPSVPPTAPPTRFVIGNAGIPTASTTIFDSNKPQLVSEIQVYTSKQAVMALRFTYLDGTALLFGWGHPVGKANHTVSLEEDEYIVMTRVHMNNEFVRGLVFFTNKRNYHGPCGNDSPLPEWLWQPFAGSMLTGLHGRASEDGIMALGPNWSEAPPGLDVGIFSETFCEQEVCDSNKYSAPQGAASGRGITDAEVYLVPQVLSDSIGSVTLGIGEIGSADSRGKMTSFFKGVKGVGYLLRSAGPIASLGLLLFFPGRDDNVAELIEEVYLNLAFKMNELLKTVEDGTEKIINEVLGFEADVELGEKSRALHDLEYRYSQYIDSMSRSQEDRQKTRQDFALYCTLPGMRPDDIFWYAWGHLCGTHVECSQGNQGGKWRGARNKAYFMDVYVSKSKNDPFRFKREFVNFMASMMTLSMNLHTVCIRAANDATNESWENSWKTESYFEEMDMMTEAFIRGVEQMEKATDNMFIFQDSLASLDITNLVHWDADNAILAQSILFALDDFVFYDTEVTVYDHYDPWPESTSDIGHPDGRRVWHARGVSSPRAVNEIGSAMFFDDWEGKNVHIRYRLKYGVTGTKAMGQFDDDFPPFKHHACKAGNCGFFSNKSCQKTWCKKADNLFELVESLDDEKGTHYSTMLGLEEGWLFVSKRLRPSTISKAPARFHLSLDWDDNYSKGDTEQFAFLY